MPKPNHELLVQKLAEVSRRFSEIDSDPAYKDENLSDEEQQQTIFRAKIKYWVQALGLLTNDFEGDPEAPSSVVHMIADLSFELNNLYSGRSSPFRSLSFASSRPTPVQMINIQALVVWGIDNLRAMGWPPEKAAKELDRQLKQFGLSAIEDWGHDGKPDWERLIDLRKRVKSRRNRNRSVRNRYRSLLELAQGRSPEEIRIWIETGLSLFSTKKVSTSP